MCRATASPARALARSPNTNQKTKHRGNWTADEEYTLALCHCLVGSHWSKMARRLPGRTENSIKNFWNATFRSKAASTRRGMLWSYIAATKASPDRERAFLGAVAAVRVCAA